MTAGKNDQGGGNLIERAFYGIMVGNKTGPEAARTDFEALTDPPWSEGRSADG